MKEKVFDVLMYLFDNYLDDAGDTDPDQDALMVELTQAGFPSGEINKAFTWLEELSELREALPIGMVAEARPTSQRVFSPEEQEKMPLECRGLLLRLEQQGVLDPASRELIIDRAMALEPEEVDAEQLRWVVLMVLFNRPGQEHNHALLEEWVMGDEPVQQQ